MVQRIAPVKVMTVTQNGECHLTITLELNINLNSNGEVSATAVTNTEIPKIVEKEKEPAFEIPDFASGLKVNFGKKV